MSNTEDPVAALGISYDPNDPNSLVRQLYGYMAWALDNPEVAAVLQQAAATGASPDVLKGMLEKTNWWKTTSDTDRQWQQLMAEDPASAQQQIAQKASTIRDALIQQGVSLDDNTINEIAQSSLRWQWTSQEEKAALDSELMRSPSILQSKVGTDYKALAGQYAVPLSDSTIQQWAAHSVSGVSSDEQYREYLVQQAGQRFAGNKNLTDFLGQGGTVSQYFDPYKQYAAQILGVNPNTINLTDDKWVAAINARQADGSIGAMTYDQWIQYLKTDPRYNYKDTANGKQDQADLAQTIGQMFGKVA
jgi:hypothetical protein